MTVQKQSHSQLHAANYNSNLHHPIIYGPMTSCIIISMFQCIRWSVLHFVPRTTQNHRFYEKCKLSVGVISLTNTFLMAKRKATAKQRAEKQTESKQLTHRWRFNRNDYYHFVNVFAVSIDQKSLLQSNEVEIKGNCQNSWARWPKKVHRNWWFLWKWPSRG